jgi:hypothetical protein
VPFPDARQRREQHLQALRFIPDKGEALRLARSPDGRKLWTFREWDDGSSDGNVFLLDPAGASLPQGAVLQFVDGIVVPVPYPPEVDLGRMLYRAQESDDVYEQFLEAWVALPGQRLIYCPVKKRLYPLVAARGEYDAAEAGKLQWMVFVPKCPETGSACVYFGNPRDVCRKHRSLTKDASLWVEPPECLPLTRALPLR